VAHQGCYLRLTCAVQAISSEGEPCAARAAEVAICVSAVLFTSSVVDQTLIDVCKTDVVQQQ